MSASGLEAVSTCDADAGSQEGRVAQLEAVVAAQAERICDLERDLSRVQALLEPDRTVLHSFLTWGQLQRRIRNLEAWLQQAILAIQQRTGRVVPEPQHREQ